MNKFGTDNIKTVVLYLCVTLMFSLILLAKTDLQTMTHFVKHILVVGCTLIAYSHLFTKEKNFLVISFLLFTLGILLQITIGYNITKTTVAIVLGFMFISFFNYNEDSRLKLMNDKVLFAITLFIYLVLLVVGENVNGTQAWVNIFGNSFQLTELFKPLSVLFISLAINRSDLNDKQKFMYITSYTLFHCIFLTVVNELGTLLLLLVVYLVMLYVNFPIKYFVRTLITLLGGVSIVLVFVFMIAKIDLNSVNLPFPLVVEQIVLISKKIYTRIMLIVDHTAFDPYGFGYQSMQAMKTVFVGGVFGTMHDVYLPAASSDYAFVSLISKLGSLYAIAYILLITVLTYVGYKQYIVNENKLMQNIKIGILSAFVSQTLISILGVMEIIPVSGIGSLFISTGGSFTFIISLMLGMLCGLNTKGDSTYEEFRR